MPSHVLVQKIFELCDVHGWERLRDFHTWFDIPQMGALSQAYGAFGGGTHEYRLSALVAILGLTFGEDLRPVFVPLNFPIDDAFHDAVWQALQPGDVNHDGETNIGDFQFMWGCIGGPGVMVEPVCASADLTGDGDADLIDVAVFIASYTCD
jgi:hypothetical protein